MILTQYSSSEISQAAFLTGVVVAALGIFAYRTNIDIMSSRFFKYVALTHLFTLLFGWMFFGMESTFYSIVGSVAACVYLVVDLQMMMGDKKFKFQLDDHCYAALQIYTDIIVIFLRILEAI